MTTLPTTPSCLAAPSRLVALGYAYPYCADCGAAPCDDVRGGAVSFVQDCFGNTVPCGH
jgi:hypothetical protein